jgi:hypothetical protein
MAVADWRMAAAYGGGTEIGSSNDVSDSDEASSDADTEGDGDDDEDELVSVTGVRLSRCLAASNSECALRGEPRRDGSGDDEVDEQEVDEEDDDEDDEESAEWGDDASDGEEGARVRVAASSCM